MAGVVPLFFLFMSIPITIVASKLFLSSNY